MTAAATQNEPSRPDACYFATSFGATLDSQLAAADVPLVGYVLNNTPQQGQSGVTTAPCRRIRVTTAGNVVYVAPNGVTHILPFASGETQWVMASTIRSVANGTTAVGINVFW